MQNKMGKKVLLCILYLVVALLYEGIEGSILHKMNMKKEGNFFVKKFYNNKLSKTFSQDDYHFFRLVFMKFLTKTNFLKRNMTLDDVVRTMEYIELGTNQKSDDVYMTLYNEIKRISQEQYQMIYVKNEVDEEIEREIQREMLKSVKNGRQKKNVLAVVPFPNQEIYNSSESSKRAQLLLDILYVAIIASYQTLDEAEKRNMLKSVYENTLKQWMSLNFLRKIMRYKLSLNKDGILLYVSLERNPSNGANAKENENAGACARANGEAAALKQEDLYTIEAELKYIVEEFIRALYPDYLGHANSAFVIDKYSRVCLAQLQIVGYRTSSEDKLWTSHWDGVMKQFGGPPPGGSPTQRNRHGDESDPTVTAEDIPENYFHIETNRNKIVVQVLITNKEGGQNRIEDDSCDVQLTIENVYNILIDHFLYNENLGLYYRKPTFVMAKYLFGYDKNSQMKDEEKKYEDISLHIFLLIKGKVKFSFKHVQKFLLKYTKEFNALYSLHFYGACIKHKHTDIIKVVGQFGEGIDNNLISNIIIKMKREETVAHIKLYSKKKNTQNLAYVSTKEIIKQINKITYFNVLYYLVDRRKEIPPSINCTICRHFKYHYVVLFIAAVVPSLIIFFFFFFIMYCKIKKFSENKNTCPSRLSRICPSFFYVRTASHRYRRLTKTYRRNILLAKGPQVKSVLKNGFKGDMNSRRQRAFTHRVSISP
ncbi:conserved Plasmodium protein, unknown function [Plasmodium knowlesi strain H]|uniref:Uncharacterized protein n=3 Tax=Plasmodium knowlesi TaxID=5850 RepID=A0A5K1VAA1_PLAKH|nr:conserved Plasmodium protein, unknown function [Plasmodium knowlesi strain H]OTN65140.1 Uncharacterized protein PKNOH_S120148800 [Plasmodium knowlesi]CAA9988345.1 conserved Plasmodium protein, unknown function [Plasmodium knowlesi strain H]SBO20092.1 conserved Plasmodium protein, unknown function [Plasmodium knowlesi strain H]SBO20300.1 conserved Plasmodium protein, unknown function [Plasmodium knowlesi strain H]VVS77819.1 conserved Plasmodium protein, unknown function [Plasmodium knowlesi |eukprot:XP_002259325.1 hypothetical protein, conserved in Plasmodium species [Plasmodium knowlesi strain H]